MNKAITPDATLVSQYIQGNEQSLSILISRHKQRIYAYIYSKVQDRNVTEDVFQDCFIKIIKTLKKGKYNEEGKFLPWAMRIAHNLCIDYFRKSKKMPKFHNRGEFDIFDVLSDDSPTSEEQEIQRQILGDVKRMINYLPEDQQAVLRMRLYQEMSFKEIAKLTDVSINTALGRMRYALINLRKLVDEHNIILTN